MRVFVWKSYGNITVDRADTVDRLRAIYATVREVIVGMYDGDVDGPLESEEDMLLQVYGGNGVTTKESYIREADNLPIGYHNKSKNELVHWEMKIDYLISQFGIDSHESFEYGTGFEDLSDPLDKDE